MQDREARLLARNETISSTTYAWLSHFQTHFFEASHKTTFHTPRIKSGHIRGAKLVRLKYADAPGDFAYYYVWLNEGDTINEIAQEWSVILWGEMMAAETILGFVPFLTYNGTTLQWFAELDYVEMGDTIVHALN
jgi:hypothetical protein